MPQPSRRDRRRFHPALQTLLDLLAACCAEPAVVIVRPSGEKSRQSKLHIPPCDRRLLREALEVIDREGLGEEPPDEEANPIASEDRDEPEVEPETEPETRRRDRAGNTALQELVLRALREAVEPLPPGVIARRIKRRDSGGLRKALRELVERGLVAEGRGEFSLAEAGENSGGTVGETSP